MTELIEVTSEHRHHHVVAVKKFLKSFSEVVDFCSVKSKVFHCPRYVYELLSFFDSRLEI